MSNSLFEQAVFGGEFEFANMIEPLEDADEWLRKLGPGMRPMELGEPGGLMFRYWPKETPRLHGHMEGGLWLGNGARAYEDLRHPEYSIQEVGSLEELLAATFAGEEEMYAAFRNAMIGQGRYGKALKRFALYNRVADHARNTWGYHENYLAERALLDITPEDLHLLGLHLASRTIFSGAGAIMLRKGQPGAEYVLAQKLAHVDVDFHVATQPTKPVVNLRDEPQAGLEFVRVHVVCGDPLISPAARKLQRGSTQLVLLASQLGFSKNMAGLALRAAKDGLAPAARAIARDRTLREKTILLENGSRISALEASIAIYGLVGKMLDREDRNRTHKEYAAVERLWGETLEKLERGEEDPLQMPAVGWKHHARWLETQMNRELDGFTPEELAQPAIRSRDYKYTRIGPNSVGAKLRENEWASDMPPRELIEDMKQNGSSLTRSGTRGAFVTSFHGPDSNMRVNWRYLVKPSGEKFDMANPRQDYTSEALGRWATDRQVA